MPDTLDPATQQPIKRPVGRPPEYDPAFVQMMYDHFNKEPTYITTKEVVNKDGTVTQLQVERACKFPTLSGFAVKIGVTRETLHDWATKENDDGKLRFPDFSYVYKMAKSFQDNILVTNTMSGNYTGPFAQFFAKNHLGYVDKTETEVNDKRADPVRDLASQLLAKQGKEEHTEGSDSSVPTQPTAAA